MSKSNVFITGARGFIGKNLVEYLMHECSDKYSLFYPYHKELDLLDTEKVSEFISDNKIDLIVHCANVGGSRKSGYDRDRTDIVETNLKMFTNLADSMDAEKRMISLGSGAEYDRMHYTPKMKEEYFGKHKPSDDYGLSKYLCSEIIEKSKNIINLRIFGMFGKYEDYEFKFISNSIVKNLLGLPIVINQNVRFDYMYINDGVKLIEKFIDLEPNYRAYNLTTGTTIDLVNIAERIIKLSGKRSEVIVKNPGFNTEYSGDNSRLQKEMHFEFTPFDVALKELYGYYKSILPGIDRNKIEEDEYIKYCTIKE
jgi:GDP-L-fucose synthase